MKSNIMRGAWLVALAPLLGGAEEVPEVPPVPEELTCPIREETEDLAGGVSVWHGCYGIRGQAVLHTARIDLTNPAIRFRTTAGNGDEEREFSATRTSAFASSVDAVLAVNVGYFEPFDSGTHGEPAYPQETDSVNVMGQHISDGVEVSDNSIGVPRFRLRVDGAFCATWNSARIVEGTCPAGTAQGVGSGPLLMRDGQTPTFTKFDARFSLKRAPRSVLALNGDRSVLWIIVVDGRQPGYSEGMNLPEMADYLRSIGATDALNLDGGGSAVLVGPEGRLLSRPIQEGVPGRERVVANHLGVVVDD